MFMTAIKRKFSLFKCLYAKGRLQHRCFLLALLNLDSDLPVRFFERTLSKRPPIIWAFPHPQYAFDEYLNNEELECPEYWKSNFWMSKETFLKIVDIARPFMSPNSNYVRQSCSVCLKGVGRNSILCPACKCWVHAKCSGLKGQLAKATNFVCSQCSSGAVADRNNEEKVMVAGSNLEVVGKFCYLGDMLDAGGRTESSTVTRVRSGWKKCRELLPLLTTKVISLRVVRGVVMFNAFVVTALW